MLKGIELIYKCFNEKYSASLILNNSFLSDIITDYEIIESSEIELKEDILYVITHNDKFLSELAKQEGNFLIICRDASKYQEISFPNSNILFVSTDGECESILSSLSCYCAALKNLHKFYGTILHAILENLDMDFFMNIFASISGNPISLYRLSDYRFVSRSKRVETNDILWDDLVYRNVSPHEHPLFKDFPKNTTKIGDNSVIKPVIFTLKGTKPRYVSGIWLNGVISYQLYMLQNVSVFNEIDYAYMLFFTNVLTSILNNSQKRKPLSYDINWFFKKVISSEEMDNLLLQTASKLGIHFGKQSRLIVINNTNVHSEYISLLNTVNRLYPAVLNCKILIHDFKIIIFANKYSDILMAKIKEVLNSIQNDIWKCGISLPLVSIDYIKTAYKQCLASIHLGMMLNNDTQVYQYSSYYSYHLFDEVAKYFPIAEYVMPLVMEVVNYDKLNQTEYGKTLYLYLKNYKDMNFVASKLFIHRNTVSYRLDKMMELFGIDFNDSEQLKNISLSFDILANNSLYHNILI